MANTEKPGMNHEAQLRHWIEDHSDAILRVCFLYLSDQALAVDALQETFIKAWRHMDGIDRQSIACDKAWLIRIAINICKYCRRAAWFRHIDHRQTLEDLPPRLLRPPLTEYCDVACIHPSVSQKKSNIFGEPRFHDVELFSRDVWMQHVYEEMFPGGIVEKHCTRTCSIPEEPPALITVICTSDYQVSYDSDPDHAYSIDHYTLTLERIK